MKKAGSPQLQLDRVVNGLDYKNDRDIAWKNRRDSHHESMATFKKSFANNASYLVLSIY